MEEKQMEKTDKSLCEQLAEKYGIVDEGDIVDLTDLEGREALPMSEDNARVGANSSRTETSA